MSVRVIHSKIRSQSSSSTVMAPNVFDKRLWDFFVGVSSVRKASSQGLDHFVAILILLFTFDFIKADLKQTPSKHLVHLEPHPIVKPLFLYYSKLEINATKSSIVEFRAKLSDDDYQVNEKLCAQHGLHTIHDADS